MLGPNPVHRAYRIGMALSDGVFVILAGLLAAWIRFPSGYLAQMLRELAGRPWLIVWGVGSLWLLATMFDLYRPTAWRSLDQLLVRLAALALAFPSAIAIGVYLVPTWRFGRGLLGLTVVLIVFLVGMLRLALLGPARHQPATRAVVIGSGPIVKDLDRALAASPIPPFRIIDRLPRLPGKECRPVDMARLREADLMIVAQTGDDDTFEELAALNFSGTTVVDAAGAYASLTGRIPIKQVDARWFIATGDFSSLATTSFHKVQRTLDIAGGLALLLLSIPVLMIGAGAIVLTNGRPVFYRQVRLGRFRRPFVLHKLRTMRRNAEPNGAQLATKNDDRVFAVGRFLRRWRLDEIPQLWNVVKGEMSLVGPRPERPEVAEELERIIPYYAFRYSVRPGVTGWAQVNQTYCTWPDDHAVKLEYDLYFLRHYGPRLYALVLLRTLGALIFQPGR